jgi:hypothetical protein
VVVQTRDAAVSREVEPGQRYAPSLGHAAVGVQQWSVAQFSKAHAAIATMDVAMRPVASGFPACAISATAVVVEQTAGTLTR